MQCAHESTSFEKVAGLRLFLENGGRGLKIPITPDQLTALVQD